MTVDPLTQLLSLDGVRAAAPASEETLVEISRALGASLPDVIVRLWRTTDGLALEPLDAHILGAREALGLITETDWRNALTPRGFLPIVDDHQANYCAVVVKEPLACRVAHVPHDDATRLLYRDFDACVGAIIDGMNGDESLDGLLYRTDGDFDPDTPRSIEDQRAARALIATDGGHEEWNYAAQLLDATNVAEFAVLLETGHFVRREVRARMQQMSSPAIKALLKQDETEFSDFVYLFTAAAKAAGLKVGALQERKVLQVNGRWIDLEGYFHRRKIPDAIQRMIAWLQDQSAGRDPRKRIGHFMAD